MDLLPTSLNVHLVPQPRKMPLPPFDRDALQALFSELIRKYPYQSFSFTPNGRGAIFQNGPEDAIELRPAEMIIQIKLDGAEPLFAETAEQKLRTILELTEAHLGVKDFLQSGVQIVATAPVPGDSPDAKRFVAEHLMGGQDQAAPLGSEFFASGVRFRRYDDEEDGATKANAGEDSLSIEPYLQDNTMVYLEYAISRVAVQEPIAIEHVSSWVDDAFEFLSGATMNLLAN